MNRYRITVTGEETREVESPDAMERALLERIPVSERTLRTKAIRMAGGNRGGTVGPLPDGTTITVERIGGES